MSGQPPHRPQVPLLSGPTGVGKTALAVELAGRLDAEIISADSMQVYRGMEIGTAQPTPDERARARFHLCGVLEPDQPFDVHRFIGLCDAVHRAIEAAGRLPIYAGGTGLYLRALRWGLSDRAASDPALRARLEAEVRELGPETMHDRLAAVDPVAAGRIAPRDAIRIVRALEVHELTGRPISQLQTEWVQPRARFPHRLIVLDMADALLRERLAARMRQMLEAGWIDETRALLARGLTPEAHCFKALGYREIAAYLRGKLTREETEQAILQRTWQFVRRQRTWLRREREATWIDAADGIRAGVATIEKLLEKDGTAFL